MFISAILGRILSLKRECLKCRQPQIVSSDNNNMSVQCKHCGAAIPPKRLSR